MPSSNVLRRSSAPSCSFQRYLPCAVACFAGGLAALLLSSSTAHAGGFELPENTTRSVAQGGTGVALKDDPSALYFNPALLPRARGFQLLLNSNFVDMDVTFARDPLFYQSGSTRYMREFDEVSNQNDFFPAPFLTLSWDLGIENFAMALGVFGPSAYGSTCYGQLNADGDCQLNPYPAAADDATTFQDPNAARHMMVDTELLEVYFTLGAGYSFDLGKSRLGLGVAGAAVYQRTSFGVVVDANTFSSDPPYTEDPETEALFRAKDLTDWRPTAFFGLSYERDGFHLGASYRPPILWRSSGTASLALSDDLQEVSGAELTDDAVDFQTWQAGSLRMGVGWTQGTHPRFDWKPRITFEANVVWEDWSRVQTFDVTPKGKLRLTNLDQELEIKPIKQEKNWQDTYSLRFGTSYALNRFFTARAGAYLETPTQSNGYTNIDFVAWERYGLGGGATVHVTDWLDLDLAYQHTFMPERRVTNGQFYHAIPLSECSGPDYDDASCEREGQPPGNPQNEGTWNARYRTASVGLTLHFDRAAHTDGLAPSADEQPSTPAQPQ